MSEGVIWATRAGVAMAAVTAPVVATSATPLRPSLLVASCGLGLLLVLGLTLRAVMPLDLRQRAGHGLLWPWALPLRGLVRSSKVDLLSLLVKDVTGKEQLCLTRGRLTPAAPSEGSGVEIYGRVGREGRLLVSQVVVPDTGEVAVARLPVVHRLLRATTFGAALVWWTTALALLFIAVWPL